MVAVTVGDQNIIRIQIFRRHRGQGVAGDKRVHQQFCAFVSIIRQAWLYQVILILIRFLLIWSILYKNIYQGDEKHPVLKLSDA